MTAGGPLLPGKVALITGASSGIGAAAAGHFAAEGAAVVLVARRARLVEEAAERIRKDGGRAVAVPGDVTRRADMDRAVATAVERFGRLDCAFNNAGRAGAGTLLHELSEDEFDRTLDVNLRGVWHCLRAQLPAMMAAGGGAIVNTSSVAGVRATSASAPYVAAKHAVLGLTRAAAAEYGEHGIRVNALVVGGTDTEMMDRLLAAGPAVRAGFGGKAVQRRLADPVEIARAAAWLCSDASSFTTGAALAVDGGRTAV
ncbi:SDR family NAD(P)-dependent oxidoreductase [Streptomyces sp. NPDC059698]|uniref:SDR family NAD(P)-dependent oxidoreductase n=1 Tax=unclassified Streptomyces TaxID=2593676 RepID=UPI00093A18D1|nr:glucose 1-dehydrogenase [Streptomyces sp. CB02366]WSS56726.1 glucose 1-dehydrogenase [Streptomyces sp. NBC_01178]